ncbi:MAG: two-component regulator propeller domain-containing protein [Bacteroidales bacterium]
MRSLRKLLMLTVLMVLLPELKADVPVGNWRHHLPNNRIFHVAETPDQIVGATIYGLVIFNKADNSVERINKVHGLSDSGISAISWSAGKEALFVGYENGNLDVIDGNNFLNVPDIMQASILGSKKINSMEVRDNRMLLACDFGIIEFDPENYLIRDTWFIGPFGSQVNVNDLAVSGEHIYAATNAGLLRAPLNGSNLADYRHWEREEVSRQSNEIFTHLEAYAGKIFALRKLEAADQLYMSDQGSWIPFSSPEDDYHQINNLAVSRNQLLVAAPGKLDIYDTNLERVRRVENYHPGEVVANDALLAEDGKLWIADHHKGLARETNTGDFETIILSGPPEADAFGLATGHGRVWVAPGTVTYGGEHEWIQHGVFLFEEGQWKSFDRFRFPELETVSDIIRISTDPNNTDRAYAAAWNGGMVELNPEGVVRLYDDSNSPLQKRAIIEDRLRVGGTAVDDQGNVWVTNSEVDTPLLVRKPSGDWMTFSSGGTFGSQTLVGDLVIDQSGQKWVILPGNGIFLLKEDGLNHNSGYETRRLTTQATRGGLPDNSVHSLAVDNNGYVWVGTAQGVAVFYSPQRAFTGQDFQAQRIVVEQADGFAGYLLESETVTAIAVDGSNKKWFGTERSGAFLLSEDGQETIFHFDKDNSPLLSNNIVDIAVEDQSGEVYFTTDRGLVSFRGLATGGGEVHQDVYAYPNPVHPGYDGYISVRGLVRNAKVKITDISGNLVWETVAEGGQAIWNGQDIRGQRPSSGVYLVFSTNEDGAETMVTKILFIN